MWLLYVLGSIYAFYALIWAIGRIKKIPIDVEEKKRIEALARGLLKREATLQSEREHFEEIKTESRLALEKIGKEKALGFPWIATAISDYLKLYDLKLAKVLENKKHPARRAAEELREAAGEKAALRRENKILRELHRYYENLFPWLIDFKGEDLDELIRQVNQPKIDDDEDDDPAALWLSEAERDSVALTRAEKFQRALERYWQSKKSPWRLGRDYERYVGYLLESQGFKVEYYGIEAGLEDLGRDLVCLNGNDVRIVQCKYWSFHKVLHEKHVRSMEPQQLTRRSSATSRICSARSKSHHGCTHRVQRRPRPRSLQKC